MLIFVAGVTPATLCRHRVRRTAGDCSRGLAGRIRAVFNFLVKPSVIREQYQAVHLSQHSPRDCLSARGRFPLAPLGPSAARRFGDDSLIHGTGGLLSQQTPLPVPFRERETCLRDSFDYPAEQMEARTRARARKCDGLPSRVCARDFFLSLFPRFANRA